MAEINLGFPFEPDDVQRLAREPSPYVPYIPSSPTSHAAAREVSHARADTLREKVYVAIRDSARGLTDEELQELLDLEGSTERPRRVELVMQSRIMDSGQTRATRSGRQAVVWVVR